MVDVKIDDLPLAASVADVMQLEVDTGGLLSEKITVLQLKNDILTSVDDELAKVSANDTTADYLLTKIVAGTDITINELNDGSNETLEIVSTAPDEQAKVSANDTTADYLLTKIVAGANVTINELNDGSNETLEIVGSGGVSTLTSGVSVAVNAVTSKVFNLTLDQNVTIQAPTNISDGDNLDFRIKQDGVGSHTVTWNAIYLGSIPTMTSAANDLDVYKFHVVNGTPIYYAGQQALSGVTF